MAVQAGNSKSRLFHYFKNKKELYLFLWDQAAGTGWKAQNSLKDPCAGNLLDLPDGIRISVAASLGPLDPQQMEKDFGRMLVF